MFHIQKAYNSLLTNLTAVAIAIMLLSAFTMSDSSPYIQREIKEVKIGNQIWTGENVSISTFRRCGRDSNPRSLAKLT